MFFLKITTLAILLWEPMEAPEIAQEVTNNIIETKEFIEGEPYFLTPKSKHLLLNFLKEESVEERISK
ncbi:MAG TPA: hypothetical protein VL943_14535 [Niabella sp.]|nr:hypothetical protein [Niabella sp.]